VRAVVADSPDGHTRHDETFVVVDGLAPGQTTTGKAVVAAVTAAGFVAVRTSAGVAAAYSTGLGWLQWPVRAVAALAVGVWAADRAAGRPDRLAGGEIRARRRRRGRGARR
jgi:hypothetical protein